MTRPTDISPEDRAALQSLSRQLNARLADFDRNMREVTRERIRRDPQAHKLTREMEGHAGYRYWPGGKDGRGRKVRFCYSTHRNLAGYYLTWREVIAKDGW